MRYKALEKRVKNLEPKVAEELEFECLWGSYDYEKESREREGRPFITEEEYNHMRATALNAGAGNWEPITH